MVWGIISGIGKAIGETVGKVVDTAKKVVSDVVEKGKEIAKAVVEHPVVRTIQETVNRAVDSGKKVVSEGIRAVRDAVEGLISANRIEDKSLREENLRKSGKDLAEAARDLSNTARTVQTTSEDITKTVETTVKQAEKEVDARKEQEKRLKAEFRENLEIVIKACEALPAAAFSVIKSLLLELADAYERDDKAKGWDVLRRIFRGEVSVASPHIIIVAILTAAAKAGVKISFWKVIGAIATWLGAGVFAKFITEEGVQRLEWAMHEAAKKGMWARYKELRRDFDELFAFSTDIIRSFLLGPFSLLAAYDLYFKASRAYVETYDELVKWEKPPEVEPFAGDIATIDKLVTENPFWTEKEIEERIDPYLPRITTLPAFVSTELRGYEDRIKNLYFAITDLKNDGNFVAMKERLDEFEKLIDEYEQWKERRKVYLEAAKKLADIELEIKARRTWIADQRAVVAKKTIPLAYIWIIHNLKPDRVWLNETPIEAWVSQKVEVQPGKHLIRSEKDGYHASSATVEVKANETKEVRIDFIKKPQEYGYLTVKSTPDSFIYIGINPTPLKTPLIRHPLPPGKYDIKLRLMGYRDEEVSVTIMEGVETIVERTLREEVPERPEKGRIFVDTEPGGAFVWVDGIVHPYPTDTTVEVDPGIHKVKIEKSGYEIFEKEVTVEAGKTVEIRHKLVPLPELRSWKVTVTSEPTGASILLDYVPTEKRTPATLSLGVGTWTIGVELPGYYPAYKTITLG